MTKVGGRFTLVKVCHWVNVLQFTAWSEIWGFHGGECRNCTVFPTTTPCGVVWWLDINVSEDCAASIFIHHTTRRNNPENHNFYLHRRENFI
jgi:hypothetical protein